MSYKINMSSRTERNFEDNCLVLIEKIKENGTSIVVYNEKLGLIIIGKAEG